MFCGYLHIYQVCEDRLSYYYLGSTLLGPYATITITLVLSIPEQDMHEWLDKIHIGGHHSTFCQIRCHDHWRFRRGCGFGGIIGISSDSSIVWA